MASLGMSWDAQEQLSTVLGYASILAWLFAQMPQVLENHRNKSVEGIALPFLLSWLFGDLTNLIGCILTHQLPFQRYLATYFVLVDAMLMSQYIYYSRSNPITPIPPLSVDYPYAQAPHHHHSHGAAARRSKSYHRSSSSRHPHPPSRRLRTSGGNSNAADEDLMTSSWMSESSTATTPARSSTRPGTSSSAPVSRSVSYHATTTTTTTTTNPSPRSYSVSGSQTLIEPPSPSISLSGVERGRTLTRSRPPHPALETISGSPASGSPAPLMRRLDFLPSPGPTVMDGELRGRAMDLPPNVTPHHARNHQRSSTQSSSRSRPPPPARRTNSMLFLSVGVLFTLGSGGRAAQWFGSTTSKVEVESTSRAWEVVRYPSMMNAVVNEKGSQRVKRQTFPLDVSIPTTWPVSTPTRIDSDPAEAPLLKKGRDWERFIGRTSAWLCTTLYLTSRLPQIWQNFRRRSVAGLSMLLFVMAFIGNSLYVASILVNPLASESVGYILESIPYLLGSGGTLCFDITIVLQSWLYSEKRREARRRKKGSRAGGAGTGAFVGREEEEGLLSGPSGEEEIEDRQRRKRSRSSRRRGQEAEQTFKMSRSVSSRRTSLDTSITDERASTERERTLSRAETGVLDDLEFDFDRPPSLVASNETSPVQATTPGRSRSRAPSHDALTPLGVVDEAGESHLTIRANAASS